MNAYLRLSPLPLLPFFPPQRPRRKPSRGKDRGSLSCGVGQGLPDFSSREDKGNWTGLDVDICRAVAAAVFNDAPKVNFVPLSAKDRFTALQSDEMDVLSRNTTWTLACDTSLGANFTGVSYYDGQELSGEEVPQGKFRP
jgi:ABC-type amino acid transport substrate-binding protein